MISDTSVEIRDIKKPNKKELIKSFAGFDFVNHMLSHPKEYMREGCTTYLNPRSRGY